MWAAAQAQRLGECKQRRAGWVWLRGSCAAFPSNRYSRKACSNLVVCIYSRLSQSPTSRANAGGVVREGGLIAVGAATSQRMLTTHLPALWTRTRRQMVAAAHAAQGAYAVPQVMPTPFVAGCFHANELPC
jgi:hypothetical protein